MKKLFYLICFLAALAASIASAQPGREVYVRFNPKPNEIFTKPALTALLEEIRRPAVIIRVPARAPQVSASISLPSTYNTIEKEFLKHGFTVRDRAIFEKVLSQNQQIDYGKLYQLTNVDLLVELVHISPIEFATTVFYDKRRSNSKRQFDEEFVMKGVKAEFKIVALKQNEVVGSYTFYWTPCFDGCACPDGCAYWYHPRIGVYRDAPNAPLDPFDALNEEIWDFFVSNVTQKIILELKK
jgi:hypothetical protein